MFVKNDIIILEIMKKYLSLCLLFTFTSLITLTSFHVHADAADHKDCSICISTSMLSSVISSAELISHIDFNSSYIVLFQPFIEVETVVHNISNRSPPVLF